MDPINISYPVLGIVLTLVLFIIGAIISKAKTRKMFFISGGVALVLTVLLFVLGVAGGLTIGGTAGITTYSVISSGTPGPSTPSIGTGCNLNPAITFAITDAMQPGVAVTGGTNYYKVNGDYVGTTAPTYSGVADIILNASGYIAKERKGYSLVCGNQIVTDSLYANATASLTYYTDNGLTSLTNSASGGAGNETQKSAGLGYNWKLHFQGTDKKSTGKQLFIVELSNVANVTSASLGGSGVQEVAVPNGYARQLTNGYVKAWVLPELAGNNAVDYNLAVQSATNYIVAGAVYTTLYNTQPFVEIDGTFSDEGKAFNLLNSAKWQNVKTFNFLIL